MEPASSLQWSQKHTFGLYPASNESGRRPKILSFQKLKLL